MLVLSRNIGQEIVIDDAIRVFVVSVEGTRVRLGIDAPESIRIDRKEIWERRRQFVEVPVPVG